MKRLSTILSVMVLAINFGWAQEAFIGSYMEVTSVSPKVGVQLGKRFSYDVKTLDGPKNMVVEVGAFYQKVTKSVVEPFSETAVVRDFQEEEFAGVFVGGRLARFYDGGLYFNIRTGVTNRQNFTITPSITTGYKIMNHVEINLGVGMRSMNPTIQGGLRLSL